MATKWIWESEVCKAYGHQSYMDAGEVRCHRGCESRASKELAVECPVCHESVTGYDSETEVLESYEDGIGQPGEPGRIPVGPIRSMVPGSTRTTYFPCGHSVHDEPDS